MRSKPGGRVAILTFHSGEDKLVKKALKAGYRQESILITPKMSSAHPPRNVPRMDAPDQPKCAGQSNQNIK